MKLSDLDIRAFGNTIQLAGAVFQGEGKCIFATFPEDADPALVLQHLEMSLEDWQVLLRQTDLMETEVLAKASDGTLAKIILRKSQRQIEQGVSWKVFKRDGYACRYCSADDVPLTVDHLVTWESGGPSIVDNLVSACRKCNKTRGDLSYADWLNHPYYLKVSKNLTDSVREANTRLLGTLDKIPLNVHKRSR